MDPGDADREELAERVEQLEEQNEQHREWLKQMMPDRRGVLKGLGAAAIGGAAVGGATGGASGQSGPAGRQGTPENPNDMFAWDLDVANEVVTDLPMAGNNITNAGSVSADRTAIAGFGHHPRVTPRAMANEIRLNAGVQRGVSVGIESGVTAGLSDSAALSSASPISITSESDASTAAASGSGTEDDPYVIKDKQIGNSSNTEALSWYDSDASYHVTLRNCEIFDNAQSREIFIFIGAGSGFTLEDCKIYGGATNDPDQLLHLDGEPDYVDVKRCHFAGIDAGDVFWTDNMQAGAGPLTVRNSLIDDAERATIKRVFAQVQMPVVVEQCEITPTNLATGDTFGTADKTVPQERIESYRTRYENAGQRIVEGEADSDFAIGDGTTFRNCRFINTAKDALELNFDNGTDDFANVEVGYCEFENIGNRRVTIFNATNDPAEFERDDDMGIHHCWSKNEAQAVAEGEAGGEPFETLYATNVHITDCWVDGCVEDAFEHSQSYGCDIWRCVGDNITDEIADLNNGTSLGSGSVAYLYGDCGGEAVRVAGVHNGHIHNVFVTVRGDSTDGDNNLVLFIGDAQDVLIESPLSVEDIDGSLFGNIGDKTRCAARWLSPDGRLQSTGDLPTWADDTLR